MPNAKDKPTKAGAVYGIARTLVTFGVDTTEDLKLKNSGWPRDVHRVLSKKRGFGDAGATYFLMLVGIPGVKADVSDPEICARRRLMTTESSQPAVRSSSPTRRKNLEPTCSVSTTPSGVMRVGELDRIARWVDRRQLQRPDRLHRRVRQARIHQARRADQDLGQADYAAAGWVDWSNQQRIAGTAASATDPGEYEHATTIDS